MVMIHVTGEKLNCDGSLGGGLSTKSSGVAVAQPSRLAPCFPHDRSAVEFHAASGVSLEFGLVLSGGRELTGEFTPDTSSTSRG